MTSLIDLALLNLEHEDQSGRPKFMFGNNGHRLVKRIIQTLDVATESSKQAIEAVVEKLIASVHQDLLAYVKSKGIFILISILEHSEFRESLLMYLQKHKRTVCSVESNPGVIVLAGKLT